MGDVKKKRGEKETQVAKEAEMPDEKKKKERRTRGPEESLQRREAMSGLANHAAKKNITPVAKTPV